MSGAGTRTVRVLAAVALAAVIGAPEAAAITPPTVDDTRLPAPRPPSPPDRTEQTGPCTTATAATQPAGGQLDSLDLQSVWRLTRGAGQTVAVIDTGVARHRLLPRLAPGGDYVSGGDGTDDCDGHGTVVAGIIGAAPDRDDSNAFTGVAPDASIIGIRQSSNRFRAADNPGGSGYGDVDTLAAAVRGAADLGATVINISTIACVAKDADLDDRALGAALAYAVDVKNVVVVAAAGNAGAAGQCRDGNPARPGRPDWSDVEVVVSPAWYDDYVLTVGSVTPTGAPSTFSLAGPWVDVAAPGEQVLSLDRDGEGLVATTQADGGEKPIAGTSYAAPVVAGVVALLRSRSPQLTARQVMGRIEQTARRPAAGWDPHVGHGVVDVVAAVTGGAEPAADTGPLTTVSTPPAAPTDRRPAEVAIRGAAACVILAVLGIGLTARRSGRKAVAGD